MSDAHEPVTLEFIARQNARLITELGDNRADMAVLLAITQRLDATVSGLLTELRAMHSRHARLERRVQALEEPAP